MAMKDEYVVLEDVVRNAFAGSVSWLLKRIIAERKNVSVKRNSVYE